MLTRENVAGSRCLGCRSQHWGAEHNSVTKRTTPLPWNTLWSKQTLLIPITTDSKAPVRACDATGCTASRKQADPMSNSIPQNPTPSPTYGRSYVSKNPGRKQGRGRRQGRDLAGQPSADWSLALSVLVQLVLDLVGVPWVTAGHGADRRGAPAALDHPPAGLHLDVQASLHAAHLHVLVQVAVHVALRCGQFHLRGAERGTEWGREGWTEGWEGERQGGREECRRKEGRN